MGAHEMGYVMTQGEKDFVRKCHDDCVAFLFICGGFVAALEAGLLEGKTATGPRPMIGMLSPVSYTHLTLPTKRIV